MKTTIVATLLAIGMLVLVAPSAAADAEETSTINEVCVTAYIRDSSTSAGPVTVETRYTHLVTACVL